MEFTPEEKTSGTKSTSKPLETPQKKKTAKHRKEEEELTILKTLASSLGQETGKKVVNEADPCAAFGAYVTQTLKNMDERTRLLAVNNIQNAIFQAQMSKFANPYQQQQFNDLATNAPNGYPEPVNYTNMVNLH